jgi:hypothetical protein
MAVPAKEKHDPQVSWSRMRATKDLPVLRKKKKEKEKEKKKKKKRKANTTQGAGVKTTTRDVVACFRRTTLTRWSSPKYLAAPST